MISVLRTAWRAAAPYVVPALVFSAIVLIIFWRVWTPVEGARKAFATDAVNEYWGDLQFQVDALDDGEMPLWNPHDRLGYPFHTDPQPGTLYPPQWPLIGAGLVLGETPWWLVSIKIVGHLVILCLGMYFVLRRRGLPPAACYLGGIVALTSWAVLHNAPSALNWTFAWVPWWLLATEAYVDRPTWTRAVVVGAVAATAALAGGLGAFWYGCLVVVPLAITDFVGRLRSHDGEERRAYARRIAKTGAVAIGVFVVLAGGQLVSTFGFVGETVRDDRGVAFFGTTTASPLDIPGLFLPRAQGLNVYIGWAVALWIGFWLIFRPTVRGLVLAAIVVLSFLCALGDRTPVLPALASILDPFELFRRAHRYYYVLVIPIAILAAEGLSWLVALDDAMRARLRRIALVVSASGLAIFAIGYVVKVAHPYTADPVRDSFAWGIGAVLVGGFLTWGVLRSRARYVAAVAVAIVGVDLWVARYDRVENSFHPRGIPRMPFDADARRIASAGVAVPRRFYDYFTDSHDKIGYRAGVRLQLRDLGGYEGDPLALSRYERVLRAVRDRPAIAGHAAIAYWFSTAKVPAGDNLRQVVPGVTEITDALPDVMWFDAVHVVADDDAAWAAALTGKPGAIAAVESRQLSPSLRARLERIDAPGTPPRPGRLLSLRRNALRAEIDAPADGLVAIADLYYRRGWTATVDGVDAPIIAVNGWARGVPVTAGRHTIEMEYSAPLYVAWSALSLAGWLAIAAFGIMIRVRVKRKNSSGAGGPVDP
jgi:hypothetical protein